MTQIAATIQKPAPRSDRDIASPQPEADLPNPPGAERQRGFGAVLREASGAPAASRADAAKEDADGSVEKAKPEAASAGPAGPPPPPADPAASAVAMLANLLNTALPADRPAGPSTGGAADGSPAPVPSAAAPAASVSPTAVLSEPVLSEPVVSAAVRGGSAAGATGGSGPVPDAGAPAGSAPVAGGDATPPALLDTSGLGSAPAVAVLDRAVHFKPVQANAASADPALTDPARPEPAVPAPPQPAAPAAADAAKPQPPRTAWPDLAAAAAKAAPKIPAPPVPRPADADTIAAAPGLDAASRTVLEDGRAIRAIAATVLEPGSRGEPERAPSLGPQDGTVPGTVPGTIPGLPAGALTTLAAAVKDELRRVAEAGPAARVQADPAAAATPDGPLRVLRIQLKPEDLGTVTVELRLTNGQLETHLRASRPETAALLHRDTAILTDLLRQANYQAEVTVGQARPSDGGGSSGGSSAQGQASFSQGGARPGPGGDRQRQAEQPLAPGRRDGERTDETVRPRDSGVYL